MKKKTVICALFLCLSLSGCGGTENTTDMGTTAAPVLSEDQIVQVKDGVTLVTVERFRELCKVYPSDYPDIDFKSFIYEYSITEEDCLKYNWMNLLREAQNRKAPKNELGEE